MSNLRLVLALALATAARAAPEIPLSVIQVPTASRGELDLLQSRAC